MSKNKIILSIPKPCNENWLKMTPVEKARFCGVCQKNVTDFTTASDRQIIEAYTKDQHLCGRFNATQLDRELRNPKEKSSIWMATTSAIITFLGFGTYETHSQIKGNLKVEQTDKKIPNNTTETSYQTTISGTVSDNSGPLPGANVIIKGTTNGVQTDLDGKFTIKVQAGDVLVFSFIGLEDKEVNATNVTKMNVTLNEDGNMRLGGMVLVGGISVITNIHEKRTFFGSIFHSIGNWFK